MKLFGKKQIVTVNVTANKESVLTSDNRASKTGEAKSNMFRLAKNMTDLHAKLESVLASDLEMNEVLSRYLELQEECISQFEIVSDELENLVKVLDLSTEDLTSELYNLNLNQIDKVKLLVLNDRLDVINEFCAEIDEVIELHKELTGDVQ